MRISLSYKGMLPKGSIHHPLCCRVLSTRHIGGSQVLDDSPAAAQQLSRLVSDMTDKLTFSSFPFSNLKESTSSAGFSLSKVTPVPNDPPEATSRILLFVM